MCLLCQGQSNTGKSQPKARTQRILCQHHTALDTARELLAMSQLLRAVLASQRDIKTILGILALMLSLMLSTGLCICSIKKIHINMCSHAKIVIFKSYV